MLHILVGFYQILFSNNNGSSWCWPKASNGDWVESLVGQNGTNTLFLNDWTCKNTLVLAILLQDWHVDEYIIYIQQVKTTSEKQLLIEFRNWRGKFPFHLWPNLGIWGSLKTPMKLALLKLEHHTYTRKTVGLVALTWKYELGIQPVYTFFFACINISQVFSSLPKTICFLVEHLFFCTCSKPHHRNEKQNPTNHIFSKSSQITIQTYLIPSP